MTARPPGGDDRRRARRAPPTPRGGSPQRRRPAPRAPSARPSSRAGSAGTSRRSPGAARPPAGRAPSSGRTAAGSPRSGTQRSGTRRAGTQRAGTQRAGTRRASTSRALATGSAAGAVETWGRASEALHTRFVQRRARHRAQGAPGYSERTRYHALVGIVALLSLLVTVKLVNIQVVSPDRYRNLGTNQRVQMEDLPGQRGTIRDRNGVDLALSVQMVTLIADPKRVTDREAAVDILAGELEVDREKLLARLSEPGSRFTYVARQIDPRLADDVLAKLTDADILGFFLEDDQQRVNPAKSLASAIVGRTDIDGAGTSGLEMSANEQLIGTPGERIVEHAPDGSTIANASRLASPAVPGADLTLTLDQTLQFEAERQLVAAVEDEDAKSGVAIMGDPRTGELLAVANVARNTETDEVSPVVYNMAFAAAYEAGSVMKLVTVAGAYEDAQTTPDEVITVPWRLQVGDHQYSDYDFHEEEQWRVDDIVAKSSNIGTVMLGQRLGPERLEAYLRSFGFGARTQLDLPGESGGLLSSSDDWYETDLASISIGQGVAVTPVQLWSAYNVIANDGLYTPPQLIEKITRPDGTTESSGTGEQRQVIRPEVASWMNSALQQVVDEGTATQWQIPGYTVGAKTGTARKPNPDTGRYNWGDDAGYRYTTVFSGFLPASDPELSITVLLDEPTNHVTGGSAAGPVFNSLAKLGLNHLRIPPDRPQLPGADQSLDDPTGEPALARPVRATPAPAATPRDQADGEEADGADSGGATGATGPDGGVGGGGVADDTDTGGATGVDSDELAQGST